MDKELERVRKEEVEEWEKEITRLNEQLRQSEEKLENQWETLGWIHREEIEELEKEKKEYSNKVEELQGKMTNLEELEMWWLQSELDQKQKELEAKERELKEVENKLDRNYVSSEKVKAEKEALEWKLKNIPVQEISKLKEEMEALQKECWSYKALLNWREDNAWTV